MDIPHSIVLVWVPALFIVFGLFEILIIPFLDDNHRVVRRISVSVFILFSTLLIMLTYKEVLNAPIIYRMSHVFGKGIYFKIDLLNYTLMVFSGFMWFVVGIFSFKDIKKRERERTFYFFYILTYISTIGTMMAGDLLSFFLFFEIMTFSSYALMVHYRGEKVLEAGKEYLYMGIIGGLFILSGILITSAYTQNYEWVNLAEKLSTPGMTKYLVVGLFIAGFGVKAGMVPFHFWVPKVYKEAPICVNAVSSGVMTKVGAYGILRVATVVFPVVFSGIGASSKVLLETTANIAAIIIWLGIISMLAGVFLALIEGNMKKMLAYHSVSQMGYIIMGIGVAAYLGSDGARGFVGSIYHMINHGIFKALLFMVAGIVFFSTGETNMYKLGGLWRKKPFVAFLALIAVFGITGMPGFNGFVSKSILHGSIVDAYQLGDPIFQYAELAFKLVSAGTVCSFIKFYGFIFLGKGDIEVKEGFRQLRMMVPMTILAAVTVIIGLWPSLILDNLLVPAATSFHYSAHFVEQNISNIDFWKSKEIVSSLITYAAGLGIFILGIKYQLFHMHLPKWLSAERVIYYSVTDLCEELPNLCVQRYEKPMIFGDVVIYAILLTSILAYFIIARI